MNRSVRIASMALAFSISVSGCAIELRTGSQPMCNPNALRGVLVWDTESGFVLEQQENRIPLIWPPGTTGRWHPDGIELLDDEGRVIGREGELVWLGGAMTKIGAFTVCPGMVETIEADT